MISPGLYRLILALVVVLYHITGLVYFGVASVYAFFALSGFWIARMYKVKYSKFENPLRTFFISRGWRLMPVYLTCVLMALVPILLGYRIEYYDKLFTTYSYPEYITNLLLVGYNLLEYKFLVSAWSLDIEAQFYLIFPLLFFLIGNKKRNINIMAIILLVINIFVLVYGGMIMDTLCGYISFFMIGILASEYKWTPQKGLVIISSIMMVILIGVGYLDLDTTYSHIHYYDVGIALLSIPLTLSTVYKNGGKIDGVMGALSYNVYLTHAVCYIPYTYLIKDIDAFSGKIPYVIVYFISSMLLAILIHYTIDVFSEKRRKNWLKKMTKKV